MKQNDFAKLEKDNDFRKSYLNRTMWWKNILMIAPVCFLFAGLTGILYLFNIDMLFSLYIIPYLILFIIGTIWLKAIKKHLQKVAMVAQGAFHVCLAASVGDKDGYTYAVFVNDTHRYDKYYITNLAKEISLQELLAKNNAPFRKKAVSIHHDESNTDMYMRAYPKKEIAKRNAGWSLNEGYFPVLYINDKDVPVVRRKDLDGKK
ncbi:MAG: hypothetical protein LBN74_05475 [Prevotella sp.]|jgi:hypothetical protein|nr:hypothetical protein [Prevotella sp.]